MESEIVCQLRQNLICCGLAGGNNDLKIISENFWGTADYVFIVD
jgi:hypothetical protein